MKPHWNKQKASQQSCRWSYKQLQSLLPDSHGPESHSRYNANLVTNWVAKFQNCLYDNDHDYDHMSSACMDHALSPMRRMGCFADTDLAIPSL